MKQHPATKFKGNYPEIQINNFQQKEMIGKRTGVAIENDNKAGLDFILQDTYTVKSNSITLGKKTQTAKLQASSDESSSSSSSSSSSDSESESLSSLSSEKDKSTNTGQQTLNLSLTSSSNLNHAQINIQQCAEDLLCPTNYDIEDKEGSKLLNNSKLSQGWSQQKNSSVSSLPKFKTKEEIKKKYKQNSNKSCCIEGESDGLTIQGLSSIQKASNSNDNSITEETNQIKAALDEPKRGMQLNKTIYEETEEELTKNYHQSQTVNKERKDDNQLATSKHTKTSDNENQFDHSDLSKNIISPALKIKSRNVIAPRGDSIKKQPTKSKNLNEKAKKRKNKANEDLDSMSFQSLTLKKKMPDEKQLVSETQYLRQSYQMMSQFRGKVFDVSHCNNNMTFGINNRYSLRTRIPKLNHLMGEKIKYIRTENGDEVSQLISCRIRFINYQNSFQVMNTSNAKLYKPLQELKEEYEEQTEGNGTIFIIKPHCKKKETKSRNMSLICEIKESKGNNWLIINDTIYKNQKEGKMLIIPNNAAYEIRNYSNHELIILLYEKIISL